MNLNNIKQIEKLDSGHVAESISFLPLQIRDALKQAEKFKFFSADKKIKQIVLAGMGGSNLGARIIASVFKTELKIPIIIEAGYEVPDFVDQNTLFIISSYSGSTEEPLSTFAEAKKRGAKIIGLTSAGEENKLAELAAAENFPCFIFDAGKNISSQPRLGLGYAVVSLLVILKKIGVLKIDFAEISKAADFLDIANQKLALKNKLFNPAKKMAQEIFGRQAVLIGGEFLEGNLHALRNQFCENSKNFADYLVLPDMNHYAIEGLKNPADNRDNLIFIFLESDLYHLRIEKRLALTREIVKKNKIKIFSHKLSGQTKLIQSFEMLNFGSWLTFYLAMLNEVDPSLIKSVDWFKNKLS
jgi:glucose/mannose-6-phosphate isomerase